MTINSNSNTWIVIDTKTKDLWTCPEGIWRWPCEKSAGDTLYYHTKVKHDKYPYRYKIEKSSKGE